METKTSVTIFSFFYHKCNSFICTIRYVGLAKYILIQNRNLPDDLYKLFEFSCNVTNKNIFINTNDGMVNTFNNFFTNIRPKLDKEIPIFHRPGGPKSYINQSIRHCILIALTNPHEIIDIIDWLDDAKSFWPCFIIPTNLLKLARNELSFPFSEICNTSIMKVSSLIKIIGNPFT